MRRVRLKERGLSRIDVVDTRSTGSRARALIGDKCNEKQENGISDH